MKATIDIPDDLYRRVEAKSALEGRPVDAVATELFERWLDDGYAARHPDEHAVDHTGTATKTRRQLAHE